jgi:hypothetical protein
MTEFENLVIFFLFFITLCHFARAWMAFLRFKR